MKDIVTEPDGLIEDILSWPRSGSCVIFVECEYDSIAVSELDSDQEAVRRKMLCFFQGDANNRDRDGMYVYEVDDVGGNALRNIDSFVQQADDRGQGDGFGSASGGERDIEGPPTVEAREGPPAMNRLSREVPVVLKCSWCSLFTSHRFALKRTRVDNDLAVITSPRVDQVASSEWAVQCTACKLYGTRSNVIPLPITPWWLQCSHCRHQRSRRRRRHAVKNNQLVLSSEIEGRTILVPILCLAVCFHHSIILSTARTP